MATRRSLHGGYAFEGPNGAPSYEFASDRGHPSTCHMAPLYDILNQLHESNVRRGLHSPSSHAVAAEDYHEINSTSKSSSSSKQRSSKSSSSKSSRSRKEGSSSGKSSSDKSHKASSRSSRSSKDASGSSRGSYDDDEDDEEQRYMYQYAASAADYDAAVHEANSGRRRHHEGSKSKRPGSFEEIARSNHFGSLGQELHTLQRQLALSRDRNIA